MKALLDTPGRSPGTTDRPRSADPPTVATVATDPGGGPPTVDRAATVGLCLLEVLEATHRAGIVHRDVKPGNVHLCDDGRVVLTDFGIAFVAEDDSSCPLDTFAGSPAYISPEQLRGDRPEPAGDLFSLGATLYAAGAGKPPLDTGDRAAR